MSTERVEYIVSLRDKASKSLNRLTNSTKASEKAFSGLGSTITRFAGTLAIGAVLKNSAKLIMDFEKSVSNLSAITGASGDDLDYMRRKAIQLAGATTKGSIETIEAFKLIASAKPDLLSNAQALAATTKEAITLSEASGLDLPNAAKSLTSALNQFNLDANQSSRVINVLAAGSKFAAAEIPDLSASLEEFGGVANSMQISVEESAAAVETLSVKNLKGSRAGIQLRNILLKLGASTDKNVNPKIVGLSKALENLAPIQDNVTELTKRFGVENVLAAQTLIKQRKNFDQLTKAVTGTNTAYDQARTNTDNLAGDIDRLGSSWETFILNLNEGSGVISRAFRDIVHFATLVINKLNELTQGQKEWTAAKYEKEMERVIDRFKGITNIEDLRAGVNREISSIERRYMQFKRSIDKMGGLAAVQKMSEAKITAHLSEKEQERYRTAKKYYTQVIALSKLRTELQKTAASDLKLQQLLNKIMPQKEGETETGGFTPTTIKPDFKAKKQIATITGAAPKTFNINVQNLINEFNVNTENITEGATEVKKQIIIALSEALADVQPITN